jgi:hypothetical protein
MKVRLTLQEHESREWENLDHRPELMARLREIADQADVETVEVYAGSMLFLGEVAPTRDAKLAAQLRLRNLPLLGDLVDPDKNLDDILRAKYADEIARAGELYALSKDVERSNQRKKRG